MMAAAVGVVAPVQAQRQMPLSIAQPAGDNWGPVVLAIIEQQRALPTGGYFCPDDESPDAVCIGATIVEGPMRIVRILSGPPETWRAVPGRPRVRFLAGHAVRSAPAGRFLALLEQTANGYYWRVWSTPVRRGWACVDGTVMTRFAVAPTASGRLRFQTMRDGAPNCLNLSRFR